MPQNPGSVISSQSIDCERQTLGIGKTTKPLPRLPRGWSRVCHETGLFLRSIGLGIVVTAFQGLFTKNFSEPEKAAIRRSRVTALLRTLIHAVPLGMAIFEIVLNWKGYFFGARFDGQNYIQFVAKAHEILMQASMATIILSYTRYQISAGNGMPFGAVLGALQFLQVSYLWSVEFWSGIMSKNFQLRRKICFVGLIVLCVVIAATAGPSSANLLIARQGIGQSKSSYLAVNATSQDIWPDQLDDDNMPSNCRALTLDPTAGKQNCSAHLLQYLQLYLENMRARETVETSGAYGEADIEMAEAQSGSPGYMSVQPCFDGLKNDLCATAPQHIFSAGITTVDPTLNAMYIYTTIEDNYFQPYTIANCVADTVRNNFDTESPRFARLSQTRSEAEAEREIIPVPGLTKGQLIDEIPGNRSDVRVGWVNLPQELFRTGVPGAIILHPQNSSDLSHNIMTCTLNAGWGSSSMRGNNPGPEDQVSSSMTKLPPWYIESMNPSDPSTLELAFFNQSNDLYPQAPISISKSWMETVNPNVVSLDNSTTPFISRLMSPLSFQPNEQETAMIINLLFSFALSNIGIERVFKVFENRAQVSTWCKNCLVLEIKTISEGWTYTARQTTTKLAIAVMFIYCILVLAHIIYSAISGVSSTAWDSVAELVALAMNSSPTETLQNTCAGIIGRKPYETNVRVLKTSEEHLELVFGEVKDPKADVSKLVMNEKYGRMVIGKDKDKILRMEGAGEIRKRNLG